MKNFILLELLLLCNLIDGQTPDYSGSNVFVNRNHNQIIINDYYLSPENYDGLPSKSTLYNMPLNCDEGIQLLPSNSFSWEKNLTIIYGENIAENRVYIFDSSGKVIRKLENVELFTFIGDVYPIFIRETKILSINLDTGQEDLIFEFDKTKYTFHSPNDPDGEGLPEKFDYYWGGIRGEIFSTNYEIEDGYTFVIDAMKKELIFWLQGHYTDLKNVQPPDKGLIKNSN